MTAEYDFVGLTAAQCLLLTLGGWTAEIASKRPPPGPKTIAKLVKRGLLVEIAGDVTEYHVPFAASAAWHLHCAEDDA